MSLSQINALQMCGILNMAWVQVQAWNTKSGFGADTGMDPIPLFHMQFSLDRVEAILRWGALFFSC